ncbi:hypothetical protein DBR06_SOUSAS20010058, partial [Sousa chinensis]
IPMFTKSLQKEKEYISLGCCVVASYNVMSQKQLEEYAIIDLN